jgi:acetyl-CoA synthetase
MDSQLSTLLSEQRRFPPPADFAAHAVATPELYRRAEADRLGFWAEEARALQWMAPWSAVLDWRPPHARWFVDGKLNVSTNCLDRHLAGPRRNKAALIWEGEPGDRRTLTYWELAQEVNRAANALRKLGVTRGDRVAIYLPMIPEAAIAMLACARIGAVHSVVFGGFSAESLRDRINDASAVALITADGGYRRGQVVPLKRFADQALTECPSGAAPVRKGTRRLPGCRRAGITGGIASWRTRGSSRRPSPWIPRTSCSSSIPRAPPGSPRASCTPPGDT